MSTVSREIFNRVCHLLNTDDNWSAYLNDTYWCNYQHHTVLWTWDDGCDIHEPVKIKIGFFKRRKLRKHLKACKERLALKKLNSSLT